MVVDFTVSQVAAVFAQLDEHLQTVAASFLFFRRHLVTRRNVFVGLAALAAALGQRLEFWNDFGIAVIVIIEISRIVIGILGGAPRTTSGRDRKGPCGERVCQYG